MLDKIRKPNNVHLRRQIKATDYKRRHVTISLNNGFSILGEKVMPDEIRYSLLFFALVITLIYFVFYFEKLNKLPYLVIISFYLLGIICGALISTWRLIDTNYSQPKEWDFLGFWLSSKVALSNENFYEPESYQSIVLPYKISDEFQEEIIDAGFWYPPFSMFLFLPLGVLDISQAYLLWQISNVLICFFCVFGIWKIFLREYGILGLLLAGVLIFRLTATRSTFGFAQTNFLNLLFFLFFWKTRNKIWSGIWLGLCIVVKPYMALLLLFPLIKKQWGILKGAILCLGTLTLLSILVFGTDVFFSFVNNPTPNAPSWIYYEQTNQSLLAVILRITEYDKTPHILNPPYLIISLILTIITTSILIKYKSSSDEWSILIILFLALLIYPANQMFYSVFLIVPICLLIQHTSNRSVKEKVWPFFIILMIYLFSGYQDGIYTFFANLLVWFVCLVLIITTTESLHQNKIQV